MIKEEPDLRKVRREVESQKVKIEYFFFAGNNSASMQFKVVPRKGA